MNKAPELDDLDRGILEALQEDCKTPLAKIGARVGLSPPAVTERVRKLEDAGIIRGYHAVLDSRILGLDVTAFVGVTLNHHSLKEPLEKSLAKLPEILEAHSVTGDHAVMLKVKVKNTVALEALLAKLRTVAGIERTQTMIALSSPLERVQIAIEKTKD